MIVENHAAHGGVDELVLDRDRLRVQHVLVVVGGGQVDGAARVAEPDRRERFHFARLQSQKNFFRIGEGAALALGSPLFLRQIINSEDDVLRGNGQRGAVGRRQDVARGEHEDGSLDLRLGRERDVNGHLVAVKVGVERRADQGMDLDRFALHQHRLEGLNAQPMERGSAVEQHRMVADDVFENVPHHGLLPLDHFLGRLDGGALAGLLQPVIDERLEELKRHLLRQPALVQLELRTDDDHRAARIIHALAEQILTEAPLFPFEGVGERLQGTVVRAAQDAAAPPIVKQRVNRFLEHALLIAHDDVRSVKLHEFFQPVVPVDDAPIQIVEIGGGKAAAVERHQRPQFRRNDRNDVQDHVLRPVAGLAKRLDHLQALGVLHPLLLRRVGLHLLAHFLRQRVDFDALQELFDGFGAHLGPKLSRKLLLQLPVALLSQQLSLFERGFAGIDHHVFLKVQDAFEIAERNVQQVADSTRQALEEPDVRAGRSELDVAQALAPDLGKGHFHATLVANHAAVLHALVLAAQAFPIRYRTKDPGAKQAVALRLESPIVDGFRLGHLSVRPGPDLFRRCQADADAVELRNKADSIIRAASEQGLSSSVGVGDLLSAAPQVVACKPAPGMTFFSPQAAGTGLDFGPSLTSFDTFQLTAEIRPRGQPPGLRRAMDAAPLPRRGRSGELFLGFLEQLDVEAQALQLAH